ncbi:hypothetical protein BSZ35_08995 [Salinibacter sp. 10B]|uniref:phosphorothioated DNA-binding restriction endonuclease n=1 Tax=Salinibacter sp. 10B TaxID=1923971 RepID=UPI000D294603|nr:HNH endonuclease [Salinibacter sp. 10B]PQJ34717.1 hypothetical protein BSZ35_08995 [Salinibacter sp. 10B]
MQASSSRRERLQSQFEELTVWKQGEQRASNKPLLILYALGRLAQGDRWLTYSNIEEDLRNLLVEFGPPRKRHHPEYPFWHLRTDGVWVIPESDRLDAPENTSDPPRITELREKNIRGGFPEDIYESLREDPGLRRSIARLLLSSHFPSSLHEDIAVAAGLDLESASTYRDPDFRLQVLQAYQYQCAICGFDLRIGATGTPIGLEAAHIKWKQAQGPDDVSNGLALCALHHKMLDKGALHVTEDLYLLVSEAVHGSDPHLSRLRDHHGKRIHTPQRTTYYPDGEVVTWHVEEVFRGPAGAYQM